MSSLSFVLPQEVVGIVRDQLVGIMDGMKAGIMAGHSWLAEAEAEAPPAEVYCHTPSIGSLLHA